MSYLDYDTKLILLEFIWGIISGLFGFIGIKCIIEVWNDKKINKQLNTPNNDIIETEGLITYKSNKYKNEYINIEFIVKDSNHDVWLIVCNNYRPNHLVYKILREMDIIFIRYFRNDVQIFKLVDDLMYQETYGINICLSIYMYRYLMWFYGYFRGICRNIYCINYLCITNFLVNVYWYDYQFSI